MKFTLTAFRATIFLGALPAFADAKPTTIRHGLKHKLAKMTGDTALLPAYCAAAPLLMTMMFHSFLPWPPNARSRGDCGNGWQYIVLVPCAEAVVVPASPLLIGACQLGVISADVRAVVAHQNQQQSAP